MVFEANILFLLTTSVFYIEDTDEIRSPAADNTVENLEEDTGQHAELRERVRESEEDLRDLIRRAAEPRVPDGTAVPENRFEAEERVVFIFDGFVF